MLGDEGSEPRAEGLPAAERMRLSSLASQWPGGAPATLAASLGLAALAALYVGFALVSREASTVFWMLSMVASLALPAFLGLRSLERPVVVVGDDGVRIRGVGRRAFVRYADIARVEDDGKGVVLVRRNGRSVSLRTWCHGMRALGTPGHTDEARARAERDRDALGAAIRARMAGHDAGLAASKLALLDRKGRPVEQWRGDLVRLVGGGSDYRRVAFDQAELAAVLDDGTATAERRIGAALALAASDREAAAPRLRVAASASANDRLRIALEKVGDGALDDADVELAVVAESEQGG